MSLKLVQKLKAAHGVHPNSELNQLVPYRSTGPEQAC